MYECYMSTLIMKRSLTHELVVKTQALKMHPASPPFFCKNAPLKFKDQSKNPKEERPVSGYHYLSVFTTTELCQARRTDWSWKGCSSTGKFFEFFYIVFRIIVREEYHNENAITFLTLFVK